jgi:Domain of unknown function (DUF4342)
MSDSPIPTPQPTETEATQQTTNATNEQTHQKKDSFSSALDDFFTAVRNGFKKINERQLVLKNKIGENVLRLPLVWAIVILLVSFAIQIIPFVVIAVIIALVTKHQFVLEHDIKTPSA